MPTLRSKIRRDLDRQRRAAGTAAHQRRQIAALEIGQACDRDPHRRHAGEGGGALDFDVAHHRFDVEALVQRDQIAALEAAQQDHGQGKDMEQRQHADHALDRIAFGLRLPAPDIIDRHRRGEIAMAQHGALRQAGGAAGILQQRDVIGRNRRPLRRRCGAIDKAAEGHDGGVIRNRRLRDADLAPAVVLADDQAVEQPVVEKLQRRRQQRREVAGDEHARAGIAELVGQCDFAVERAEMHDPGAGLQHAEEAHRMIRRIAEEQRDRMLRAIAGAQQGRGSRLHHRMKLGIADRAVAEFDRRPVSELCGGVRQQIGQRAARDRIVPMHALRIELLARMGHRSLPFPPPLRGRVREGGRTTGTGRVRSPPAPPRKGEGSRLRLSAVQATCHQAAFAVCASDAKVLPSAASRFSSGAGSSEGSLVCLA